MSEHVEFELAIEEIPGDSEDFLKFLESWSGDIENHFPDFSIYDITFATVFLLKVNKEAAGLFVYEEKGEELHVEIDYLIPKFRNQNVGEKFYESKLNDFKRDGFELIIVVSEHDEVVKYLKRVGFEQSKMHNSRFELPIK